MAQEAGVDFFDSLQHLLPVGQPAATEPRTSCTVQQQDSDFATPDPRPNTESRDLHSLHCRLNLILETPDLEQGFRDVEIGRTRSQLACLPR